MIKSILGEPVVPVDYDRVPWAIYCHPEVAFAGLTEAAATEAGFDVVVKKDPFGGNSRARIMGDTEGLVKVVAERRPDGRTGRILGVHMVGPWVTEQLGRGTWPSIGRPPPMRWPSSSSPTRRCPRLSVRRCWP